MCIYAAPVSGVDISFSMSMRHYVLQISLYTIIHVLYQFAAGSPRHSPMVTATAMLAIIITQRFTEGLTSIALVVECIDHVLHQRVDRSRVYIVR